MQCLKPCTAHELGKHLQEHAVLLPNAQPYLHMAQPPFMDSCESCLIASHLPDFCPVICGEVLYNGSGAARGRLHARETQPARRPSSKGKHRAGNVSGHESTHPTESQLQAQAQIPRAFSTSSFTKTPVATAKMKGWTNLSGTPPRS